jgi:hypothetical protein
VTVSEAIAAENAKLQAELSEAHACLGRETKRLIAERDQARAEVEGLKDSYTTCEQCDGPTEAVQFCAKCWNALAKRSEASDLQVRKLSTALEKISQSSADAVARGWADEALGYTDKQERAPK